MDELLKTYTANRSQINSWLWIARHSIRQGETKRALEAMWTALWLLGVTD